MEDYVIMSNNTKLVILNLDYELKDTERSDGAGNITPYSNVTRNLINIAFQQNHTQGMDAKIARIWRSVRKQLDSAIDDEEKNWIIFAQSDFDSIYDEVYKCKYLPAQSIITPYLCDELDKVKHRGEIDEERLQRETLKLEDDIEHEMNKLDNEVLNMGKEDIIKKTLAEAKKA